MVDTSSQTGEVDWAQVLSHHTLDLHSSSVGDGIMYNAVMIMYTVMHVLYILMPAPHPLH